ncbi:IS1167 transposase [Streptococcus pneumoniae]|nr:IS1167 transposase [Streptococcus pneumoniae]
MEQLHFITKLLDIKDPNIQILDIINKDTHKEIIAKLDYDAPSCPECGSQMKKYDFQKPSKIPYLGLGRPVSFYPCLYFSINF